MATQSRVIWDNGLPATPATVTMFWDDVSLLLTRVVIDNRTGPPGWPVTATATVNKNGRTFNATVQPGNILDQNVPTNTASRMELFINPDNGRLDGVTWSIS